MISKKQFLLTRTLTSAFKRIAVIVICLFLIHCTPTSPVIDERKSTNYQQRIQSLLKQMNNHWHDLQSVQHDLFWSNSIELDLIHYVLIFLLYSFINSCLFGITRTDQTLASTGGRFQEDLEEVDDLFTKWPWIGVHRLTLGPASAFFVPWTSYVFVFQT